MSSCISCSPSSPGIKRTRSADGSTIKASQPPSDQDSATVGKPQVRAGLQMPAYLDKTPVQIASTFQDLEWQQRYRLVDGAQNESSPYRLQRSQIENDRNRYQAVSPWHNSRVRLKDPIQGSDYINASPIVLGSQTSSSLEDGKQDDESDITATKYIACQGPKTDIIDHFWHMVHQQVNGDVGVIVMLTPLFEQGKEKCSQYFPDDLKKPTINLKPHNSHHSQDKVTLLSLEKDDSIACDVRKLSLAINGQSKTIFHYLFHNWPDFGEPTHRDRKALIELTRRTLHEAGDSPRIVHCSAGVGRTGTWIALDHLIREVEEGRLIQSSTEPDITPEIFTEALKPQKVQRWGKSGPEKVSTPTCENGFTKTAPDLIYETVNTLREQRMMMVMNDRQLAFLYEAVREAVIEKYRNTPEGARISEGAPRTVKMRKVTNPSESSLQIDDDAGSEAETEIIDGEQDLALSDDSPENESRDPYGHITRTALEGQYQR